MTAIHRRRHVLAVGSSYPRGTKDTFPHLKAAIPDAELFQHWMLDPKIGAASVGDFTGVLRNPTREELIDALSSFFRECAEVDADAILYFAGHAQPLPGGKWAFVCTNTKAGELSTSAVTFTHIEMQMRHFRIRRKVLVFDTCFARAASPDDTLTPRSVPRALPPPRPTDRHAVAFVWASTEIDTTSETDTRGVLLAAFERGLAVDFAAPPNYHYISTSMAMHWVVSEGSDAHRPFTPDWIETGHAAGLFLFLNRSYDAQAPAAGTHNELLPATAPLDARLLLLQQYADAWERGGRRFRSRRSTTETPVGLFIRYDPVEVDEVCILASSRRNVTNAEFLWMLSDRMTILLLVHTPLFVLLGLVEGYPFLTLAGLLTAFVLVPGYRSIRRRREYDPRHNYVVITKDGFISKRRGVTSQALWEDVEHVTYDFFGGEVLVTCRPVEGRPSEIGFGRVAPFGNHLKTALQWGRNYRSSNWRWAVLAAKDKEAVPPKAGFFVWGVQTYAEYEHLPAVAADVRMTSELAGARDETQLCLDESKNSALERLRTCLLQSRGGDAVVYFSGHGTLVGGELMLLQRDSTPDNLLTTGVAIHEIAAIQAECQVKHLLLILDCCYSGASLKALSVSESDLHAWFESRPSKHDTGLSIIAACDADERAFADPHGSGSVFTQSLVDAAASALDDGVLSVSTWYQAVASLAGERKQPSPVVSSTRGDERIRLRPSGLETVGRAAASRRHWDRAMQTQREWLMSASALLDEQLRERAGGVHELRITLGALGDFKGVAVRSQADWIDPRAGIRKIADLSGDVGCAAVLLLGAISMALGAASYIWPTVARAATICFWAALIAFGLLIFVGTSVGPKNPVLYVMICSQGIAIKRRTATTIIEGLRIVSVRQGGDPYNTPDGTPYLETYVTVGLLGETSERLFIDVEQSSWNVPIRELTGLVQQFVKEFKAFQESVKEGAARKSPD